MGGKFYIEVFLYLIQDVADITAFQEALLQSGRNFFIATIPVIRKT